METQQGTAAPTTERGSRLDGQKVREARRARGWNGVQLAKAAGIDQSVISRIESGQRTRVELETAQRLASALRVSLYDLLADGTVGATGAPTLRNGGWRKGEDSSLMLTMAALPVSIWGHLPRPDTWQPRPTGGYLPVVSDTLGTATGRLAAFQVDDDHGMPEIAQGEWVVIDRDKPAEDGRLHVLSWQGNWVVRRLKLVANDWASVVEGGTTHPPTPLHQLRVLGCVVWITPGGREAP